MATRPPGTRPLTPKQAAFVREYLVDLNATQAAIRAGYSAKTAKATGHENLTKPDVAAALRLAMDASAERIQLEADDVLRVLARLLHSDIRQAFSPNGALKPIHEIPDDVALAISSVEVDELFEGHGKEREQVGFVRKVKFWSKDKAVENAMRRLGMLRDRTVLENPDGSALFDGAKSRVAAKLMRGEGTQ